MAHLRARISSNSSFAFLSQLIRLLTNLLLFVGIARFYGVASFGQFTAAHTLSTIFLLAADFGFDTLLPTQIAVNPAAAALVVRRYFSLKILFAFVATVAMLVVSFALDLGSETALLVRIFAAYVLFGALSNFFFAVFKGYEQFQHETRISFITSIALLALLAALGALRFSLVFVAAAFVATRIIMVGLGIHQIGKVVGPGALRFTLAGWREVLPRVMVFGLHFLFGNLFFQVDTVMLAWLRGDRDVGVYQGAYKVAILTLVIPDIAVTSMLPLLSSLHPTNPTQWRMVGRLLNKLLFLLSLPVSLVLFVFPSQIIGLVFGQEAFGDAVPVLRIFALIVFVRFGVDGYALMLTTAGRQVERMQIVIGGTILNVMLNLYFIPRFGTTGAALVSLGTNLVVGGAYIWRSGMPVLEWSLDFRSIAFLVLTLLMAACGLAFSPPPLWVAIPLIGVAYACGLYWWGLRPDERALLSGAHAEIAIPPTDTV